ncbi:MAG: hypothetical protein ACYDGR_14115 [Candidatus Dormibacteria bacterium]
MRLRWTDRSLRDLEVLAERAPAQAASVYNAAVWLASLQVARIGRHVRDRDDLYWPVPPQGIFYFVKDQDLVIVEIVDVRRRRDPW